MILLDTNVLSELMRPQPDQRVMNWISSQPPTSLFTTSITQAEILHGIHLLPDGKRRRAFEVAALEMFSKDFDGRILAFDSDSATAYAVIAARRHRVGRPISQLDTQIAAIAAANKAPLATRNVMDFEGCEIGLIDPWRE
jgi:toxin FitB